MWISGFSEVLRISDRLQNLKNQNTTHLHILAFRGKWSTGWRKRKLMGLKIEDFQISRHHFAAILWFILKYWQKKNVRNVIERRYKAFSNLHHFRQIQVRKLLFVFVTLVSYGGRVTGRKNGLNSVPGEMPTTPSTCIFYHSICMIAWLRSQSSSTTPYHHRNHSFISFPEISCNKFQITLFLKPFSRGCFTSRLVNCGNQWNQIISETNYRIKIL